MKQSWKRVCVGTLLIVSFLLALAIPGDTQSVGGMRGFEPLRVAAEHELEQKLQSIPDPARAESNLRHLTS